MAPINNMNSENLEQQMLSVIISGLLFNTFNKLFRKPRIDKIGNVREKNVGKVYLILWLFMWGHIRPFPSDRVTQETDKALKKAIFVKTQWSGTIVGTQKPCYAGKRHFIGGKANKIKWMMVKLNTATFWRVRGVEVAATTRAARLRSCILPETKNNWQVLQCFYLIGTDDTFTCQVSMMNVDMNDSFSNLYSIV